MADQQAPTLDDHKCGGTYGHHPTPPKILPNPIENPRAKEPNPCPAPYPPQPAICTPTLQCLTQLPHHQLNPPPTD